MELEIVLLARFKKSSDRDKTNLFFNADSRPFSVEEVDSHDRLLFERVEDVEFPEATIALRERDLLITWFAGTEFDEQELSLISNALFEAGCDRFSGIVLSDGFPCYSLAGQCESLKFVISNIDEDDDPSEYGVVFSIALSEKSFEKYLRRKLRTYMNTSLVIK